MASLASNAMSGVGKAPGVRDSVQSQQSQQSQHSSQQQQQQQNYHVASASSASNAAVFPPGLRYPTNGKSIYTRPLNRTRTAELSQSSFAYLFSEMVGYAQRRVTGIQDLEKRLNEQGHPIGIKLLDLLLYREPPRNQSRSLTIIALLHFVKIAVWPHLFGRQANGLEKSSNPQTPDEYMIIDNEPLVNQYISVPREMSQLNCAAYVAGIVEGVCDGAGFPARVTAHTVGRADEGEMWPGKTVFLVKFDPVVLEREAYLGKT